MRWIRLDVAFDESWLFPLSPASQLAWIKLLCTAKRDGIGGRLKIVRPVVAARKWGVGEEDVVKMLHAAVEDGAIAIDGDEWVVENWKKFQETDTTVSERVRRYRAKKTNIEPEAKRTVTEVTPLQPLQNRNPVRATETETLTETETFSKRKQEEIASFGDSGKSPPVEKPDFESEFEDFRREYPKRAGDSKAAKAKLIFEKLRRNGIEFQVLLDGARRYRAWCDASGKTKTELVQQIPTWLNGKAWLEEFEIQSDEPPRLPKPPPRLEAINGYIGRTYVGRDFPNGPLDEQINSVASSKRMGAAS